jgi:ATP-dependent helicase HrpB
VTLEAAARGAGRDGALLAAILGERDLRARSFDRRQAATTVDSDPIEGLELFLEAESRRLSADAIRSIGLDMRAVQAVDRARRQIERTLEGASRKLSWEETTRALREAVLAGFPDRVARRRGGNTARPDFVFANGGSGQLGESSGVRNATLVVVVDAEERRIEGSTRQGGVTIRSASAIEPEWLIDIVPDALSESVEVTWNANLERAEAVSRMQIGAIVLDESPVVEPDAEAMSGKLLEAARAAGPRAFCDPEALASLLARAAFAARTFPEAGINAEAAVDAALSSACRGRRSFAELREASVLTGLTEAMGGAHLLARYAPEAIVLPGGRKVAVHYESDRPPWIESRLQDFFGLATGPVLGGRVPVVLHLLAPNKRAVQVTTDLSGFWQRQYPATRRELMRQYPRHSWPENPLTAAPPAPGRR